MPVAPDLCGAALDGRYELHAVIGEGAFGRVYRGLDRRLARPVAVKVIKPWWAEDPEWVGSFEREAQLLARVSDPAIVQIFDVGHAEEGLYYVSELVDGESLADRLKRGSVGPWDAAALTEQLCRGLAHAHAQRIIHRDVKPANILISSTGRVKVGDFGVARLAEGSSDGALATVVGTPRYMAPEQGSGKPTTPATDVYSAGIVLYEMLAGEVPFAGTSIAELALAHLQTPPPPLPPGTPPELAEIVGRALAKDPADRYADAGEMARALAVARRVAPGSRVVRGGAPINDRPVPASAPVPVPLVSGSAAGAALGAAGVVPGAAGDTRPAPARSPRRRWNPAARRRTIAAFAVVLAVLVGLLLAAVLVGSDHRSAVPALRGLRIAEVRSRVARGRLRLRVRHGFSASVPAGAVASQRPGAGRQVDEHSTVTVTVSRGPAPVSVLDVRGEAVGDARLQLRRAHLNVAVITGPDPGHAPGTVYKQSPLSGTAAPGSTVTLSVAETPRWRTVTAFTGRGSAHSVPFSILGSQWRVVYSVDEHGLCGILPLCSDPSARAVTEPGGTQVQAFGLGSSGTQVVHSGPGTYEVQVSPGSDDSYTVTIQDYY
jgi:hypothetical protein